MGDAYRHVAEALLDDEEGNVSHVYRCTEGYRTVGRGVNLDSLPDGLLKRIVLTEQSIRDLNEYKLLEAIADAIQYAGQEVFDALTDTRKAVLISMAYQLGGAGLLKFVKAQEALRRADYTQFIADCQDSRVARDQTPERWERQLKMFGEG